MKATLDVLQTIASKYAKPEYSDVVVGIQLLNEPASYFPNFNLTVLEQFYQDGYDIVRNVGDTVVVLHDAFRKPKQWNGFLSPNTSQNGECFSDGHEICFRSLLGLFGLLILFSQYLSIIMIIRFSITTWSP